MACWFSSIRAFSDGLLLEQVFGTTYMYPRRGAGAFKPHVRCVDRALADAGR
jgi:hypothetical protein